MSENSITVMLKPHGWHQGYEEGYMRGRANAIAALPRPVFPVRPLHILYIPSGKSYPYSPIDSAIIDALQLLATRVTVTDPSLPFSELALQQHPDLVLALDGLEVDKEQMDQVRRKGIRTAVWLTDDPYYTDLTLPLVQHFDHVFTLEVNCLELYQQACSASVHYLPLGVSPSHFHPLAYPSNSRRELSFTGSAYWSRIFYLQPIMGQLMQRDFRINGLWWDRMPDYPLYADRIDVGTWLDPSQTNEVYNGSKIIINLHRSHEDELVNNNLLKIPGSSPNPRTFEVAASSAFQLTDMREDLPRFYEPGVEIETYSSPNELLDKVHYYLEHEEQRRNIALKGLERTLRDHTYMNRIDQLLTTLFPG